MCNLALTSITFLNTLAYARDFHAEFLSSQVQFPSSPQTRVSSECSCMRASLSLKVHKYSGSEPHFPITIQSGRFRLEVLKIVKLGHF